MRLEDALFNWLQIYIVSKARPNDRAAKKTADFFHEILTDDHKLHNITVEKDGSWYTIHYDAGEKSQSKRFPRPAAEQLLADIESEPKYNQ